MQANPDQSNAFPSRFFGLGLKGFMILAVILLVIEIAFIFAVFGTDLIFQEIDVSNLAPGAQQASLHLRQSMQNCIATARTFALIQT
ncbi:MAG: hypothetical protein A4S14_04490 [Proteobacteria bacterium SG_bin9]|nr:MAG: hypothetical protein A4S14_04490 [Proteobacteria bacterium SG_bin9]